MTDERLPAVFELIDAANSKDPDSIGVDGYPRPAALVYGERMSAMLEKFAPDSGDPLRIAVRAQHIERWTCRRDSYPAGRIGYLKWRSDLKTFHARRAGELMQAVGYEQSDRDRVAALIRKEGLKRDPETQTLEDVACLVFLEHYASDFIVDHDDAKVADILAKTARKMSARGLSEATGLPLSERLGTLLNTVLGKAEPT